MATTADQTDRRVEPQIRKFAVETDATDIKTDSMVVSVRYDDRTAFDMGRVPDVLNPVLVSTHKGMALDFY